MSSYSRQTGAHEQVLYDYLLRAVDHEPPDVMVQQFRELFIQGTRGGDRQVLEALDQVVRSQLADEEFRFVLNRCCHILINRWQARSQSQPAILELISLFNDVPVATSAANRYRSRSSRRLTELVAAFCDTEQYLTLQRLARVLRQQISTSPETQDLGTLIPRYPYLYEHCLLNDDSISEQQLMVKKLQAERQRQFEVDLSRCVTSMVRRAKMPSRMMSATHCSTVAKNPTLLSDRNLGKALKHYIGRVDGVNTYQDLANRFVAHSRHSQSYSHFKQDLFEYITASVQGDYGSRQFNNQLYQHLKHLSPQNDNRPLSDFLMVRTCSQLLNFLVVDNAQNPHHFVFMDLISNVGPLLTTGLLLKIVLICRKVKPYLERRLSILFSHYETAEQATVQWLVQMLENVNLALCLHFGNIDLSFLR
jgi:hypothetical protein